jgi:hypothetical protein
MYGFASGVSASANGFNLLNLHLNVLQQLKVLSLLMQNICTLSSEGLLADVSETIP